MVRRLREFTVVERGPTDLTDLSAALLARGYVEVEPRQAMLLPGQFQIRKLTPAQRALICRQTERDAREESHAW